MTKTSRIAVAGLVLATVGAYPCSISYPRRLWAKQPGSESELFAFERNGRVGFIDRTGKVVIAPTINARIDDVGDFSEGLAPVSGQGYIDQAGRWAIRRKFWPAGAYSDGVAWASIRDSGDRFGALRILLDRAGNTIATRAEIGLWPFSEGLAAFEATGKPGIRKFGRGKFLYRDFPGLKGFLDRQGQVAIEAAFAAVGSFHHGLARAVADGYCHVATPYGGREGSPTSGSAGSCGGAPEDAVEPCRTGFIDRTGRFVIEPRFEAAQDFQEMLAAVRIGGLWGFVDVKGSVVIPPRFEQAKSFSEGLAAVKIQGKWGFIHLSGEFAIQPSFQEVEPFSDSMALTYVAQQASYIDRQGRVAIPGPFREATPFVNGLAAVLLTETQVAYINHAGRTVFQYRRGK